MARRLAWLVALALLRPAPAAPGAAAATAPRSEPSDVVFRVPEVMVQHASSQKSVGTRSMSRVNSSAHGPGEESQYEEYFVEHDISTVDARKAAHALDLDQIPQTRPGCGVCSRRELEYCESRLIADHCCCELRYFPEPFPWVPHTCYMGRSKCRPLVLDCARYARLRDCCCYRKIAERWKHILSGASTIDSVAMLKFFVPTLIIIGMYI